MEREEILAKLNDRQQEAVLATEGPELILAGAGSGKTRVLVHRISYLINVLGVLPGSILAITFTNKAANEMKTRVDDMIGFGSHEIWVMTFHAFCVRVLRRHAEALGFTRYFTIYDTDDQLRLLKDIYVRQGVDPKRCPERATLRKISKAKNEFISPEAFARTNRGWGTDRVADLYGDYQKRLREANAMDFDDLLVLCVRLFTERPEILNIYQERFHYMMVDEYQDTNTVQFKLVKLLSAKFRNLCVVGDDDQSIYKFRGADVKNILNFEDTFPDAKVVRLEQNYRSTQNILDAANAVIANNGRRKEKALWTNAGSGEKIRLRTLSDGREEAAFIANEISQMVRSGERNYKDFAVLYRTNAQSRPIEESMMFRNVPYKLVGGVNFYARKEIKDILAYLRLLENPADDISVQRIINIPKRGIGDTTIRAVAAFAGEQGLSFYEAVQRVQESPAFKPAARKKLLPFTMLVEELQADAREHAVDGLLELVIKKTGYVEELERENTDEANERIQNINELCAKAAQYMKDADEPSLGDFLEEVALIADIDTVEDGDDRVLLMTLHAAKGLEFPVVYLAGMEEGTFPSEMCIKSENEVEEVEEERRLCYVGITRAKEALTLTSANERFIHGSVEPRALSRFVREIPRNLVDMGRDGSYRRPTPPKGGFNSDLRAAITKKPSLTNYNNPYLAKAGNPGFGKPFPASGAANGNAGGAAGNGKASGAGAGKSFATGSGTSFGNGKASTASANGTTSTGKSFTAASGASFGNDNASTSGAGKSFAAGSGASFGNDKASVAGTGKSSAATPLCTAALGYDIGDKVRHMKFGTGTVLAIRDRGRDFEVTVDFPAWGTKKMFAAFAKLVREE